MYELMDQLHLFASCREPTALANKNQFKVIFHKVLTDIRFFYVKFFIKTLLLINKF